MGTGKEMQGLDDAVRAAAEEVARNPDDELARERLLESLSRYPDASGDPRRVEQIRWLLERNPRHRAFRTYGSIDANILPADFRELKDRWLELVAAAPADEEIIEGAIAFLAPQRLAEAWNIARAATQQQPGNPALWFLLGRIGLDREEAYLAFERALKLGHQHPSLITWLGKAAFDAGNDERAAECGRDLLRQAEEESRASSAVSDWPEQGDAFWRRAARERLDRTTTRDLATARSDHAFHKHHGHTLLGLVACRQGRVDDAAQHLLASGDLTPDYRLSAYGPSLRLIRALLNVGEWECGLDFLRAWKGMWDDSRIDEWIASVERFQSP